MSAFFRLFALVGAMGVGFWPAMAAAEPCRAVTRDNLAQCVLQASPELRAQQAAVRAASGRVQASEPWLPSSPEVAVTASQRRAPGQSALNWSASLGVQLEVAGQRGARRRSAAAEREAQRLLLRAVERETRSEAFALYFEVLAARESAQTLSRLDATTTKLHDAALAAAERGVGAGVDAQVAEGASLSVMHRLEEARRDEQVALASLSSLLGLAPNARFTVTGTLTPLPQAEAARGLASAPEPPEAQAFAAESRAALEGASALRRSRIPSPTLSVFVQREGFNENVVGLGLGIPLPLPEPLSPLRAGDIAEREATSERARALSDGARRVAQSQLTQAALQYDSALRAAQVFNTERVSRAATTIDNLATEVSAGHLSTRDALVLQQPLFDILLRATEIRRELCLASVALLRAAGPQPGGTP